MRRTLRRTLATVAAASLVVGLSACSDEESPSASDDASGASTSSEPTDSDSPSSVASPSPDDTTDDEGSKGEEVDTDEFLADMKAGLEASTTARMEMSTEAGTVSFGARGEVDYSTNPAKVAMTIDPGVISDEEIEMRVVDGVMYMDLGRMSNGKFVEFDLNDPQGLPPALQGLAGQMDPLAGLEQLEPAVRSVTFVGADTVDGEELDRYELAVDTRKMEAMQQLPGGAGVPRVVDYDLWFDDEFRMRRMDMKMDLAQPVSVEVELFDWDEPVDIQAPPASQVVQPPTA